jgi:surfeit locus 1 family protein
MTEVLPPKRFPILATISCMIGVLILIGLGFWQVERLEWKTKLQQEIDKAFAEEPNVIKPIDLENFEAGQVLRGQLSGSVDVTKSIVLQGKIVGGQSAVSIVAPMTYGTKTLMLELGCSKPTEAQSIIESLTSDIGLRDISATGVIRFPIWSRFAPNNEIEKNQWWRLDSGQIGKFWNLDYLSPFIMTVEAIDFNIPNLEPCPFDKTLRNNHLHYAIFWFTMGFVLLAMWGLRFLKPYLQSA